MRVYFRTWLYEKPFQYVDNVTAIYTTHSECVAWLGDGKDHPEINADLVVSVKRGTVIEIDPSDSGLTRVTLSRRD